MSADGGIRRRPLHKGSEGQKEEAEQGSEGQKEETEQFDWGVDDEGWTPEKRKEDTPAQRQKNLLRRSNVELSIAFVCHASVMLFYIAAHVYDGTVFKRSKGKGFEGTETYGGRWKFFTYINFWLQFAYFFLSFFTDIMPRCQVKIWFQKLCDFIFTTAAFPLSIFVFTAFWGIYAIDRELIYPARLDEYIPSLLNHFWHTTIVLFVLIEILAVFHRYPSNGVAASVLFLYSTAYVIWIVWIRTTAGYWVYPFFNVMPPPLISVFFATSFFVALGVYFLGKGIAYLKWGERHRLLEERGL